MTKKKRKQRIQQPSPISMDYEPDVPVNDFFEYLDFSRPGGVEEALENLIYDLESDYFLQWEAVVCEEEGLPLTQKQKQALGELINFGDEWEDDRILYINEIPRPQEPWYEIAKKVVSRLVDKEPFDTTTGGSAAMFEGWPELLEALETHAIHLSLPEGVESPLDIFSPEIVHQLNLQLCMEHLSGLGQCAELTLENEDQQDRIECFIEELNDHKEMVRYFDLTLESLPAKVKMPAKEEKIFMAMMIQQLKLPSDKVSLLDFLFP